MVDSLGALTGTRLRVWRVQARGLRPHIGGDPGYTIPIPSQTGLVPTPAGEVWLAAVPRADGFWLEIAGAAEPRLRAAAAQALPVFSAICTAEREIGEVVEELASRVEEIDLLYAISEILGHTVRLAEAADTIVREVSNVVGARRASIMVYDDVTGLLRTVAARGFPDGELETVRIDDPESVAARVWRENRNIVFDPTDPLAQNPSSAEGRNYLGQAFLSIPICYAAPGTSSRCVGVINLTDRAGGDAFTAANLKLVSAIANQIGAAIENARLVARDLQQQRVRRELELAHDLQLKLLPDPSVLQGDAEVAALCRPAESVGGDFYTFGRLGHGRVGVMLGDVSSHGFSAALVMALVMSAAGIHTGAESTPDETLAALLESLEMKLASTEMFLSVFYGVLDPQSSRLTYANAGHPHAFRIPLDGDPHRLETTAPPLGLSAGGNIERRQVSWVPRADLLCLWTDGLVEARSGAGAPFTEERLLWEICRRRTQTPDEIVQAIFREADVHSPRPIDDRTLLVMRV